MNDTTLIARSREGTRIKPLGTLARRLVFARLANVHAGLLRIRDAREDFAFGAERTGIDAAVTVLDPAFYSEIAFGGSVGAGE